jgi:arsenate reductase (thioredoxin)
MDRRQGAFADTYRVLNNRIGIFTNLPVMSLDGVSLQRRLGDIGKSKIEVTREKA